MFYGRAGWYIDGQRCIGIFSNDEKKKTMLVYVSLV